MTSKRHTSSSAISATACSRWPSRLDSLRSAPPPRCGAQACAGAPARDRSDRFRHHLDRAARALRDAQAAALAIVVVELESLAGTELHDRVVGAHAVAVVALEAVAARQAAPCLVQRTSFVEAALHLVEVRLAPDGI